MQDACCRSRGSRNMHGSTAWVSTYCLLFILTPSPLLKSEGQISLPQHCPASFLVDMDWYSNNNNKKMFGHYTWTSNIDIHINQGELFSGCWMNRITQHLPRPCQTMALVNTSVPQSAEESNWQIVTNSIFHVTTVSLVKCNVAFFYCYI